MAHTHRLLLGAHMSIAGGFELALDRGASIDCTAIQIFTKSGRQWHAKEITEQQAQQFKAKHKTSPIGPIIVHASYLINIGSSDEQVRKKSVAALIEELNRCHQLGIEYLVLHPGSAGDNSQEECLNLISKGLDHVFGATQKTMVLLENMAGQGSVTCYNFEQLAFILKNVEHSSRLGICFDTCHAFAAGYDFTSAATYKAMWAHFDSIIGLKYLKAIHLNDSKKELGSHVDRHEEIGKGTLGLETFKLIMNDENLFDIPKILETPNDTLPGYAHNMSILKELLTSKNKALLHL